MSAAKIISEQDRRVIYEEVRRELRKDYYLKEQKLFQEITELQSKNKEYRKAHDSLKLQTSVMYKFIQSIYETLRELKNYEDADKIRDELKKYNIDIRK